MILLLAQKCPLMPSAIHVSQQMDIYGSPIVLYINEEPDWLGYGWGKRGDLVWWNGSIVDKPINYLDVAWGLWLGRLECWHRQSSKLLNFIRWQCACATFDHFLAWHRRLYRHELTTNLSRHPLIGSSITKFSFDAFEKGIFQVSWTY